MNLEALSLAQAAQLLRTRKISSRELTEFFLGRISTLNPTLNAFITVTADAAREAALRADEERSTGVERGPLQGIPVALKDLFDTSDAATTAGSSIFRTRIPNQDATVVARLRAAGAVLVGKTNMHEWAFGVTNDNPHFGRAANPWEVGRIPGGSSGGSAVAVSARLALGALGSDTGGSIRIPSALCGITGLKPTAGRVSLRGVIPLSPFQDHAGPMAQTAEDCVLLLQAIAGYDEQDPASEDQPVPDYSAGLEEPIAGWRFGVPGGYFERNVDPEIAAAVESALGVFEREQGWIVRKEMPFAEEMFDTNRLMLSTEAAAVHEERFKERRADYGEDVALRLKRGASVRTGDYVRARRRQAELVGLLREYFSDVNILVTPTTRVPAERWGDDAVSAAGALTGFTGPFNVTGFPAISIPCGFTREGLPIGLQLVARRWSEAQLLQAAHQYQRATDWHRRRPPVG